MASNIKQERAVSFDGDAVVQGGVKEFIYLINKADFDDYQTLTFDGTTDEITAMVLASGTQGYKIEVPKSSHVVATSPYRGVGGLDGFDHTVDLRIEDVSQLSQNAIAKLRYGKVVVIVPRIDGKFLLFGRKVGMRMSDYQFNPGDADTGGTLQAVIKTPDNDPPELDPPHIISSDFDITTLDGAAA